MQLTLQIAINASPQKVWEIISRDFDKVGEWASGVTHSYAQNDALKLENAPMAGRICKLSAGGEAIESFLDYDEKNMTFTYEGKLSGLGLLVPIKKRVNPTNNWSVKQLGSKESLVIIRPCIQLNLFGLLLYPIIKWNIRKVIGQFLEELKYYIETGKIHPRKLKDIEKE